MGVDQKSPGREAAAAAWVKRVLDLDVATLPQGDVIQQTAEPLQGPLNFPKGSTAASIVELSKIRLAWQAARAHLTTEVESLGIKTAAIINDATGLGADFQAEYDALVSPVLATFDDRLGGAIDDLRNQTDAGFCAAAGKRVTEIIGFYRGAIADDGVLAKLEHSPVVDFSVRQELAGVLDRLALEVK